MSWLTGITEKAGDLLNKLDQSAADVFHNDESDDLSKLNRTFPVSEDVGVAPAKFHDSGSNSSLSSSASVPANLHQLKQTASFVSSPVPRTPSVTQVGPVPSPKASVAAKPAAKQDTDDALFEFLNSNETVGNAKKKSQTPPLSRRKHSRQSSASSTVSNKNGSLLKENDLPDVNTKVMEQSVVSQMTASAASVEDLNLDLPDQMSVTSSHHSDEADQTEKQVSSLELENRLLRNEIAALNEEMATVIQRAKDSQQEVTKLKTNLDQYNNTASRGDQIIRELQARETDISEALAAKDSQLAVLRIRLEEADQERKVKEQEMNSLRVARERVLKDHTDSSGVHSQALDSLKTKLFETETSLKREQEAFKTAQEEASRHQAQLEKEIETMRHSLNMAQKKGSDETSKLSEMANQVKTTKASLDAVRQELSDYKDKASRILQSKERLIASLREGSGASGEAVGVSSLEYDAVKQERDMFKEELQQNKMTIENLRVEIQDVETQLQHDTDTAHEQLRSLEEQLNEEKRRKQDSEHELIKQKQELQYSLEELHRQKVSMTTQISDREKDIQKLRSQLTNRKLGSTTENELESRVKTLTESLIQKQTMLESLSTEKNSLSLQLERLEQQYKDVQASAIRSSSAVVHVADDEEVVRQRLPAFMREGPSDTEVTRKMKRAANVIDKFSIRLGVFLRRYPIARVFVIMYMALLHIWVMIVLLTYQPEIHGAEVPAQPKPPDALK